MPNASRSARVALMKIVATGNAANILGGAVQLALLCGSDDEKAMARVADRAISAFCNIEPQQGTTRQ